MDNEIIEKVMRDAQEARIMFAMARAKQQEKMNLGFLRLKKVHKSLHLNHKCKYCDSIKINFTPTKQPINSIIKVGLVEYRVHETGAWIRQ